jgi:hypothetical protein
MGTVEGCSDGIVPKSIQYCFSEGFIRQDFIYKIKVYEILGKNETDLASKAKKTALHDQSAN